ncbi:MAG: hypothetical protein R2863_01100 [Candidatus Kapaibacterium sp.]
MRKSKTGHRKYIRKILQIEDKMDFLVRIIDTTDFRSLLSVIEKELDKRFSIIESKLELENQDYLEYFESSLEQKKFLEKETTYLNEEGILDWVRSTGKTQIVPSPFYSYGKAAVIITPLFNKDLHIGYYLALSKNNRLLFDDIQINNIDKLVQLFNSKLISLFYESKLKRLESNIEYYEKIILNSVNYLDGQLIIESTSEKISQSLSIVKNNLNLLDKDSETFYTRLNKITNEIDNISEFNSKLTDEISDKSEKIGGSLSLDEIINEILEVMNHEFLNTNIEISFIESTEKYYINSSKGKIRSAIINLLVHILNKVDKYNILNIYYKKTNSGANISFYLGVENYSFISNTTLDSPIEVPIPKELEITKKLLNSIDSKLEIVYVEDLGYFFNILVK